MTKFQRSLSLMAALLLSAGAVVAQGLLASVNGIADTGFLVAFANRNDHHHAWAVDVGERLTGPLLTCEAVLAAAAFHLGDVGLVLAMVRDHQTGGQDCKDNETEAEGGSAQEQWP